MESDVLQNRKHDLFELFSNGTDEEPLKRPLIVNMVASFQLFIFALFGIVGNSAVMIVSYISKTLRMNTGNMLVAYLSLVDLLTTVFAIMPSTIAVAVDHWPFGIAMCRFQSACFQTFIPGSSGILGLIALDRLIAIAYPLHYKRWVTEKLLLTVCAIHSCVFLSLGLLSTYNKWDILHYNYDAICCYVEYEKAEFKGKVLFYSSLTLGFYIPAVVIIVSYTIIVYIIRRSRDTVQAIRVISNNGNLRDYIQNDSNDRKAIKSLMISAFLFFSVYLLFIASISSKQLFKTSGYPYFYFTGVILVYNSSAVNPFIYAIFRKEYRHEFKKLFKRFLQHIILIDLRKKFRI